MARIYFKQRNESCNTEWTVYGSYCEEEITNDGDFLALVHDITNHADEDHLKYSDYQTYIEPESVTEITKEEYESVISKLASVEDLYDKADEIMKSLL